MPDPGASKSNFHLAADPALSRVRCELEALVRNSIRLWPTVAVDADIPIGTSKLGGKPDLPPDLAWPEYHVPWKPRLWEPALPKDGNSSVPFVAQFNLEDLAQYDVDRVLPKTGMLYVFYNPVLYSVEAYGMREAIQVFYRKEDKHQLTRREFPSNIPISGSEPQAYTACTLQFTWESMLPPGEDCRVEPEEEGQEAHSKVLVMTRDEYSHWLISNYEFRKEYGGVHHMLGYPDIGSHGPRVPDELFPMEGTSIDERVARFQDHRLLLQLDDSIGDLMKFRRGRTVYFCMRNQDLLRADFSRVWVDIE